MCQDSRHLKHTIQVDDGHSKREAVLRGVHLSLPCLCQIFGEVFRCSAAVLRFFVSSISQSKKQVLRMCLFRTDDCRPPVDQRSKWDTPLLLCYVNLMSLWLWSRQNKISCMKKLYGRLHKETSSNLQWAPRKTYTQVYTWKFQSLESLPA